MNALSGVCHYMEPLNTEDTVERLSQPLDGIEIGSDWISIIAN